MANCETCPFIIVCKDQKQEAINIVRLVENNVEKVEIITLLTEKVATKAMDTAVDFYRRASNSSIC